MTDQQPSGTELEAAWIRFEASDAQDTSPAGRRIRLEARLGLYRALLADGWEPDDAAVRQAELDALSLRRLLPAAQSEQVSV